MFAVSPFQRIAFPRDLVVPHAAFKSGKMFAGSFDDVMRSRLLRECFEDC